MSFGGFGLTLRYLWVKISAALGYLGLGVAVVAQAVGLALRYLWVNLAAALGYLWRGVAVVAQAVSLALRYLWHGVAIVAQTVGLALRYLRVKISAAFGYLWHSNVAVAQAVGLTLRYAWVNLAAALVYVWQGIVSIVAQAVGLALRYLWVKISEAFGYARRVVVDIAQAAAVALRYLWRAVAAVAQAVALAQGYLWHGVTVVAQAVGLALGYAWRAVAAVAQAVALALGYLGRGIAALAQAVGLALRYGWRAFAVVAQAVALVLMYLGLGVAIVAEAIGMALRYAWRAFAAVAQAVGLALRYLWHGIVGVAQAAGLALRYLWMGVSAALGYLGLGVSSVFRPLWLGASAILQYIWLGVSTTALVLGWAFRHMWQGILIILQGLSGTPVFVARTVWTAFTASPDVLRAAVWVVKRRKGVSTMPDHDLTRERLISVVVTVLVFFTIAAVGVRMFWPAPPEPTVEVVHWVTGHLYFGPDLPGTAAKFNDTGPRTKSGKRIVVEIHNAPSSEGARDLIARVTGRGAVQQDLGGLKRQLPDPTIITPSGAHWLVGVNHQAGRMVVDPDAARSIARAYIGIVTYRDMAECLGWPEKELGFADIMELRADSGGWKKYECAKPSWGEQPIVAYTDPRTSSTGRSVLLSLYAIAAGKRPEDLTIADVDDPKVVDYVKGFQKLIDHYLIGTTVLNTKIYQGPRYGHFFIIPEDNLVHLKEGSARAIIKTKTVTAPPIERPMVMIYPKEGSMVRNNCACIVHADWVTEEQVEAAEKWIDFILEDEQQRVFMAAGFRPTGGLTLDDPSSKVTSEFGLDPTKPTKELNPALIAPEVAAAIDRSWEDVKRPGIVTFVVDTSGSMMGNKLKQAKDGLVRALDSMAENNRVGFLSFDDTLNTRIPVAPLAETGSAIADAVRELRARGETALYDAVKAGVEMTDAAEGDEDAIRAVVVLTDGRANRCQTRLDELIQMESRNERPIPRFGGCEGDPPVKEIREVTVEKEDIIGTRLAIETDHHIQIFFIGIGDDADLEVGRILAEATGAEFQGVTEEDLANLLEEFSGYF